ncbi:MAG: DUF447 family protein [Methanolinea sp.]|nr:DUF447 family protein [Methanolinea sp.]
MGLLKEGINEVIATTRDNAAPMGIILRSGSHTMVVFHGSHTSQNISRYGWVVANIVYDPVLYVKTAFSDLEPRYFSLETVGDLVVQRLSRAEAWVAFRAEVTRDTGEALVVNLTPLREEVCSPTIHPVNRGFSSVIEATIHATRYIRREDSQLGRLISHHASIVRRCGGPREKEALALLEEILFRECGFRAT